MTFPKTAAKETRDGVERVSVRKGLSWWKELGAKLNCYYPKMVNICKPDVNIIWSYKNRNKGAVGYTCLYDDV